MKNHVKISIFLSILALFGTTHVDAAAPVVTSFTAAPDSPIEAGDRVDLNWSAQNSSYCLISGRTYGDGMLQTSGSAKDFPKKTTRYSITCKFANDASEIKYVTVNVIGSTSTVNPTPTTTPPPAGGPTPTPTGAYVPQPPPQNQFINTACAINPASPKIGDSVTFSAATSGGKPPYEYIWSGVVSGPSQSTATSFSTTGYKTATITAIDSTGYSAQSSCSVNIVSGTANPTLTTPPAGGPKPSTGETGKVEGATTVCKQVNVCFDISSGKITETPITPSVAGTPTPSPTKTESVTSATKNDSKTSSDSFLATIFNVKGDVWGKIKSLVIWYIVILLVIVLIVLVYMGIKRMKSKKELAATQTQNQQKPKL